jgi:hypothetical protein
MQGYRHSNEAGMADIEDRDCRQSNAPDDPRGLACPQSADTEGSMRAAGTAKAGPVRARTADEIFVADVASLEWEVLRWRRLKTNLSRTRPTVYRPWTGMNGGHYPDVNLRFERSI